MAEDIVEKYNSAKAHQLAQINPLTPEEKQAIWKVMDHFHRNGASLPARARLMVQCAEFTMIYRPRGIQDMAAFIDWAFAHDIDADEVMQTILHDLSERNEPFMAPRTHGYSNEDAA